MADMYCPIYFRFDRIVFLILINKIFFKFNIHSFDGYKGLRFTIKLTINFVKDFCTYDT